MEKLKRKKKREQMRRKGLPVDPSSSESDLDEEELLYQQSRENQQQYHYDIYGPSSAGGSNSSSYGTEVGAVYGGGGGGGYGAGAGDYGEEVYGDGTNGGTYYEGGGGGDYYGGGGGDGASWAESTYDNFDSATPNNGAIATGAATTTGAEDPEMLTDMYLEEEEEDEDGTAGDGTNNGSGGGGGYDDSSMMDMDAAPQLQIDEHGRVILNQSSVTVTRAGPKDVNYDEYERVTETFGSRHITQATFARHRDQKTKKWTDDDTRRLFDAVQQFGTDFSMIVRLFPTRARREVRNKFKKEERAKNPNLIYALKHRKPIDIETFKRLSAERDKLQGVVRKTKAQILAEQKEQAEREAAQAQPNKVIIEHHEEGGGSGGGGGAYDADEWEEGGLETVDYGAGSYGTSEDAGLDTTTTATTTAAAVTGPYEEYGAYDAAEYHGADDYYYDGGDVGDGGGETYGEVEGSAAPSSTNRVIYEDNDDLANPTGW